MRRFLVATFVLVAIGLALGASWVVRATPAVRDHIVAALNQRFASEVALDAIEVDVFPRPRVAGQGLTLRHRGRTDVPPLITIDAFASTAGVFGLTRQPVHLRTVSVEGLNITVPRGALRSATAAEDDEHTPHEERRSPIRIDEIRSRAARLQIASGKPGRLPRIFDIHDLVMYDFGAPDGARFEAGVTNPVPKGRVETSGTFGPWHADEPGLTPVRGQYTFDNANLDAIKGISGTLSSVGTYRGRLERIEVEGQTETPDFSIDLAGQPVPLSTRFHAIVDGTNGDTYLEKVEAVLGQSRIHANGAVVRTEDVKGRHVALDVRLAAARLEDLVRLAVKGNRPPLTGRVEATTSFVLPAGDGTVIDRLQLAGEFRVAQARFSNVDVQKKITMLSLRGRGEEAAVPQGQSVVSNMGGRFVLKNARLTFSELTFGVPGAVVQIAGTYDLHSEALDFTGYLLTDATLADMTSGFKSVVARLAQPLFRRAGGGSRLPIRIHGPRSKPSFGLDVGRVFGRG